MRRCKSAQRAAGYTMVELLVGLFLSVFIVAMTLGYLLTSAKTFAVHSNEVLIQENARFAFTQLARIIKHAGSDPTNSQKAYPNAIFTQARCAIDPNRSNQVSDTRDCTRDELSRGSDRLAVTSTVAAGTRACDGSAIDGGVEQWVQIATVLWTADIDRNGIASLYCQTLNLESNQFIGLATPLVEGVELLQFQFALDVNRDGVIDQYQNATNYGALANLARVRAIRVAFLVSPGSGVSIDKVAEQRQKREYQILDGSRVVFYDKLPRSVYSTVFMLPSAGG